MTYKKPEIAVLGDAVRVIQSAKPDGGPDGGSQVNPPPAYELDEE